MPKRPRTPPAIPAVIEHQALQARWRRGEVVIERAPAEPGQPRSMRLRATCAYDRLHARGGITDPQREAADRYAALREAETGARWRPSAPTGIRTPRYADSGHPIISQVQAAAQLRRVHEVLGRQARAVVALLVVDNLPVKEIAERHRVGPDIAMGMVLAALTRLAEHWGMT